MSCQKLVFIYLAMQVLHENQKYNNVWPPLTRLGTFTASVRKIPARLGPYSAHFARLRLRL